MSFPGKTPTNPIQEIDKVTPREREKARQLQRYHKARQAEEHRSGFGRSFLILVLLAILLMLPVIALKRQGFDSWEIGAYAFTLSVLTYAVYASDKNRARMNAWRIPEAHLHLLEMLGGWPGAWLAQQRLRHKCSKVSYQCFFWLIILTHQFAAYDSLQHWRWSHAGIQRAMSISHWLRMKEPFEPEGRRKGKGNLDSRSERGVFDAMHSH